VSEDLDAIRRRLEERRDVTRERVAALAQRPELGTAQGFGKRIGDGTVEAVSRLTDIGVGSSLESGLARIERALAKLDEGTYGSCDACGEPIAPARLQAMPDSVLCVAQRAVRRVRALRAACAAGAAALSGGAGSLTRAAPRGGAELHHRGDEGSAFAATGVTPRRGPRRRPTPPASALSWSRSS
jgi:DnaK suppressor protein